jgi:hypothetical protein
MQGVLFYDPGVGQGEFYTTDGHGGISRTRLHAGWRSSWTHIIPGQFGGSNFTDLLFYDSAGTGEFYTTDERGRISLLKTHTGWQSSGRPWTQIIPGQFGGSNFTDLLFYDSAGTGEFYTTDGHGGISLLKTHTGWQSSGRPWTHIIPGQFGGSGFTDLLFYDSAGTGEFYTTDGHGEISLLKTHTGWQSSGRPWTQIIPGQFGGSNFTDLLFYDSAGTGEFYTTDGHGGISLLKTHTGWRSSWTQIIPGEFGHESIRVRLHFKSLLPITTTINQFIDAQFLAMEQLFATVGITTFRLTTEDLSGDLNLQPLQNLNIGRCLLGQPTQDQIALFANRNNIGNNELVVYIVSTLIGVPTTFVGCATHPDGQPGVAVVQSTANWLTAHEVGHVLGLRHVCEFATTANPNPAIRCVTGSGQSDSLMFPFVQWTNLPPDLSAAEEATMLNSDLTS